MTLLRKIVDKILYVLYNKFVKRRIYGVSVENRILPQEVI